VTGARVTGARRIAWVSRVVADLDRAAAFYRHALGFRIAWRGPVDRTVLSALGMGRLRARQAVLRLGGQTVALVQFSRRGRRYPPDSRSDDLWFQHLAIVVSDIEAAYARLERHAGWRPITDGPPQKLPQEDGRVRAYKFRDPDGHPLELLWFPPGQGRAVWHRRGPETLFLGIDHSALSIASPRCSVRFYKTLGWRVTERTLNHGPRQAALDGLAQAHVQVTALRPCLPSGPGLELLAYQPPGRATRPHAANDLVTDWTTLAATPGRLPRAVRDPDGHILLVAGHGGSIGAPAWGPIT